MTIHTNVPTRYGRHYRQPEQVHTDTVSAATDPRLGSPHIKQNKTGAHVCHNGHKHTPQPRRGHAKNERQNYCQHISVHPEKIEGDLHVGPAPTTPQASSGPKQRGIPSYFSCIVVSMDPDTMPTRIEWRMHIHILDGCEEKKKKATTTVAKRYIITLLCSRCRNRRATTNSTNVEDKIRQHGVAMVTCLHHEERCNDVN